MIALVLASYQLVVKHHAVDNVVLQLMDKFRAESLHKLQSKLRCSEMGQQLLFDLSFDLYLVAIVCVRRKAVNAKYSWWRGNVFDLKQACIKSAVRTRV